MARFLAFVLALGFVTAAPAAAHERDFTAQGDTERRQGERRIKWWLDEKARLELGITPQQSADIEQIFQSTLPTLRQARKELEELESRLSQMIKDGTAPVAAVTEQVERVESARAEMNKLRTVMLYRINRVLSADQRGRLKAWHERQGKPRQGDGPDRH
jgi:Spy/CpxP family protein refolding chaperone